VINLTDAPELVEWYEDEISDDEDFGDFTEKEIIDKLGDIAENAQKGVGRKKTDAIRNDDDFLQPFINTSGQLENSFRNANDLNVYKNAINRNFKTNVAKEEGIPLAISIFKSEFKSENDYFDAQDFLRIADSRRLGGFKRGEQQIAQKAFRVLFG